MTPILGITMGDAAGIGPEIIAAAWHDIADNIDCRPVVYGHPEIMRRAVALRQANIEVVEIPSLDALPRLDDHAVSAGVMPCLRCTQDDVTDVRPGTVDARAGEAAYQAISAAIEGARASRIDAVVTAPIHKAALNLAGYHYPGHTEIFAEKCAVTDFAMMLYLGPGPQMHAAHGLAAHGLAVVHVTLHTAMRTIFDQITVENILAKAKLADGFMRRMMGTSGDCGGISPSSPAPFVRPRIGVCSLNPHAGEDGLFGTEEIEIIRPAVEQGRRAGLDILGPFPADTIMIDAKNGRYDAIVAMFHDQGHIALKLLNMHGAVNVTLGLPIIRTSVAHGTAFDRAWQDRAHNSVSGESVASGSMIEAVRVAARLAKSAVTDRSS